ncbi:hypothetical protein [Haloarcula marina]|uniref:hypothetical protein n=1 Tax=Haloarcula marina TaxID=2961574 RepID=UPI0020B6D908|nr:hypothetical protein [Halomicroarcula marina]
MIVVYELVRAAAEVVAPFVGVEGALVSALAATAVGLYYAREAAGLLVVVARWLRIASFVVGAVAVVLAVGTYVGVVDLSGGSLVAQALNQISEVVH